MSIAYLMDIEKKHKLLSKWNSDVSVKCFVWGIKIVGKSHAMLEFGHEKMLLNEILGSDLKKKKKKLCEPRGQCLEYSDCHQNPTHVCVFWMCK